MKSYLNEQIFTNKQYLTKESSYLLGFIWGDGYLHQKLNKIAVEIIKSDYKLYLEQIVDSTGHWTKSYRERVNRKPQAMFQVSNKTLVEFLNTLNYDKKSFYSHQKAIEFIPEDLQKYWLRGYFDADGCIYINKKNYCNHISFCSTYDQDWDFLQHCINKLGCKFKIIRRIQKSSKHSVIRISSVEGIINFRKYIYPTGYDFGFYRKYEKLFSL